MMFTPLSRCEGDDCETLTDRRLCRNCKRGAADDYNPPLDISDPKVDLDERGNIVRRRK